MPHKMSHVIQFMVQFSSGAYSRRTDYVSMLWQNVSSKTYAIYKQLFKIQIMQIRKRMHTTS